MKLTRRQTIKRASEFAWVRARGTSDAGRFLVLSTAPLPAEWPQESRFGLIVTKRVGHAVIRNTLRRRVREILRFHGEPLSRGWYVVLILRNRAALADYHQLEKDFLKLLARHPAARSSC